MGSKNWSPGGSTLFLRIRARLQLVVITCKKMSCPYKGNILLEDRGFASNTACIN